MENWLERLGEQETGSPGISYNDFTAKGRIDMGKLRGFKVTDTQLHQIIRPWTVRFNQCCGFAK